MKNEYGQFYLTGADIANYANNSMSDAPSSPIELNTPPPLVEGPKAPPTSAPKENFEDFLERMSGIKRGHADAMADPAVNQEVIMTPEAMVFNRYGDFPEVNYSRLPDPPSEYVNTQVQDIISNYNQMEENSTLKELSADDIREIQARLIDAVNNLDLYEGTPAERESKKLSSRLWLNGDNGALKMLSGTVSEIIGKEKYETNKRIQDSEEANQAYAERNDWRRAIGIKGIEERSSVPMEMILGDSEIRDQVFDNLFAPLNGVPHLLFQEAWDVLTDEAKYKGFMSTIRSYSEFPSRIPFEALLEYASDGDKVSLRAIKNEVEGRHRGSEKAFREELNNNEVVKKYQRELAEKLGADHTRYSQERQVREKIHNANALIEMPKVQAEQIYGYIEQIGSRTVDYAHRMRGVKEMMDIYEQVLRQIMYENDGYLPSEQVLSSSRRVDENGKLVQVVEKPRAELLAKEMFKKQMKSGLITQRADSINFSDRKGDEFEPYQVDQVFNYARGMMLLSQRLLSLASEAKFPKGNNMGTYVSFFMQDAIQSYNPHMHLMLKYMVPNKNSIAALYTSPDREKFLGIRKPWFVNDVLAVKDAAERSEFNAIFDGEYGEKLQIRRQSPAHIGDVWTYVSWRAGDDRTMEHGAKLFVDKGYKRMSIWAGEDINEVLTGMTQKEISQIGASESEVEKIKEIYDSLADPNSRDKPSKAQEEYLNEYANWRGTGLRFEFLRQKMSYALSHGHPEDPSIQKGKDLLSRIVELQPGRIFLKSGKIQKRLNKKLDDLASKNAEVFTRGEEGTGEGSGRKVNRAFMMSRIQENLSYLERQMYTHREDLIKQGYTFDGKIGEKFDLRTIYDKYAGRDDQGNFNANNLPNPEYWEATWKFYDLMQEDFKKYKDHTGSEYTTEVEGDHGKMIKVKKFRAEEEGYYQEFIYNREYNHDYTLWSGDSPVDEFNMGATGATGAFIRRAGENKDCGEGHMLMVELLSDLKKYHSPDEVYEALNKVYSKVKSYDADKAKEMVFYLTEAICKMYKDTGVQNMPLVGPYIKSVPFLAKGVSATGKYMGKAYKHVPIVGSDRLEKWSKGHLTGSLAQTLWDSQQAESWGAREIKELVTEKLYKKGMLKEDMKDKLLERLTARDRDIALDVVNFLGPLAMTAFILYILKESTEDTKK